MASRPTRSRRLFAAALLLALAGCGGGGGGDDGPTGRLFSPGSGVQGEWQRTVVFDGQPAAAAMVAASDVPAESDAAAFTPATVAQLEVARFPGKTVGASLNVVRVVDPDTDFTVVVNSVVVSDYVGCGSCAVGTRVSLTIRANLSESGTLDGVPAGATPRDSVLTVRYERLL